MRRGRMIGSMTAGFVVTALATTAWAATMLVDNFDKGQKPNLLGGDFGSWDKDPSDPTQKCTIAFDKAQAFGGNGYALRIDYDVDSPNPAYNGFWMKLQDFDATPYKHLAFYIRGDATKGFSSQVKLELKNNKKEVGRYLLKGITDQWQQAVIPLQEFSGLTDVKGLTECVIVFDDLTSNKKTGAIFVDDIAFQS